MPTIVVMLVLAVVGCGDDDPAVESAEEPSSPASSTTSASPTGCTGDLVLVAGASAVSDVWIEEGGDVVGLDADGAVRRLTEDGGSYAPSVSPDGERVVFASVGAEGEVSDSFGPYGLELYSVAADGSDRQQLTDGFQDVQPDWSPDGERIVFVRQGDPDRDDPPDRIHVVGADGTGEELLVTHDGPEDDGDPAWSPHGTRLAFVRRASYDQGQVMVVDADGSGAEVVHEASTSVGAPTWSPDGSRLAFPGSEHGESLVVLDVEAGTTTEGPARVDGLDWAPNGLLYGFARPPAVDDFSGEWRLTELAPEPNAAGFGVGRAIAAVDPIGFLYFDYRVDVAACTGPEAPTLTGEADEPDALVITHPETGEDVSVLTRDQASALALDHIPADERARHPTEAMLLFGDEPTNAALQAASARLMEIPDGELLWLVAIDGGLTGIIATTGDQIFAGGGPTFTLPDVPDLAP